MPKSWEKVAQQKRHREHLRRMRDMKSSVDDKPPRQLPKNNKKEIERERYLDSVEKGNRLLLDRLGKAMENKNIDNECHAVVPYAALGAKANRRKKLFKITNDNYRLLDRIQKTEPVYNVYEYERDAELRDTYLKTMSEFPDLFVPKYQPSNRIVRVKSIIEKRQQSSLVEKISTTPLNLSRNTTTFDRGYVYSYEQDVLKLDNSNCKSVDSSNDHLPIIKTS